MSVETPPKDQTRHLPAIQALRGLAALAVVVVHLGSMEARFSPDRILGDWTVLGLRGVDLFFVISGFVMVYVSWNGVREAAAAPRFLWRRATRIYPLYWIITGVLVAVYLIRPDLFQPGGGTDPTLWKSLALWPDDGLPFLSVGWTLVHEMYFYLVFALALLMPRGVWPVFLGVWAGVVIAAHILGWQAWSNVAEVAFSPLTLQFLIGAMFGWLFRRRRVPTFPRDFKISIAVLIALGAASFFVPGASYKPLDFPGAVGWGSVFGLTLWFAVSLDWQSPHALNRLGDWSYSLYLIHIPVLAVIVRLWQPWAREGIWDNIVMLVVMVAASVAASAVSHRLIERPIIRWFRARRGSPTPARASH